MKKMIVVYKTPPDADAFMGYYRDIHLPLVRKIPGLVKIEVTRITRTILGEPDTALVAELCFADEASFREAMRSPENAATGADLGNFAEGLATVMIGDVIEL